MIEAVCSVDGEHFLDPDVEPAAPVVHRHREDGTECGAPGRVIEYRAGVYDAEEPRTRHERGRPGRAPRLVDVPLPIDLPQQGRPRS